MHANSASTGAREIATDSMTTQSVVNLVIDKLDEFAAGIFSCATSSDYAVGSL